MKLAKLFANLSGIAEKVFKVRGHVKPGQGHSAAKCIFGPRDWCFMSYFQIKLKCLVLTEIKS